jgi:hypothetical protein
LRQTVLQNHIMTGTRNKFLKSAGEKVHSST